MAAQLLSYDQLVIPTNNVSQLDPIRKVVLRGDRRFILVSVPSPVGRWLERSVNE